jgi:oxepin-CoA hydrolase/3-oxo-5,6-dehydrosuberyl-CoA semialdehyde dehydrogenase
LIPAVAAAMRDRLSDVVVGNPANPDVTMGPVASLDQREEIRRAVKEISAVARFVSGDPNQVQALDADAERGAFLAPILMLADSADVDAPHSVEPFGPVSTLMPYDGVADVVRLAARGEGSLAASIVTHDAEFARSVALGLAPYHGRVLILDRDDAGESTGHGAPLPHLVHGGPGRAGGGEELGGIRSVLHHMQRTAIQGSPAMIKAIESRGADDVDS